jgi:hypothetical protein
MLHNPERAEWDQKSWEDVVARVTALLNSDDGEAVTRSEFSPTAVLLALGAMQVSFHKYGSVAEGYPKRVNAIGKPDNVDRRVFGTLGSFGKRLTWYFWGEKDVEGVEFIAPGNVEYLIDAMNFLMIEFMRPAHPKAHYKATDRWGSPGRVAVNPLYEGKGVQYKNSDLSGDDD